MVRTEILEVVERAVIAREPILTLSSFLRDTGEDRNPRGCGESCYSQGTHPNAKRRSFFFTPCVF